jgi:hypothetical protein
MVQFLRVTASICDALAGAIMLVTLLSRHLTLAGSIVGWVFVGLLALNLASLWIGGRSAPAGRRRDEVVGVFD